jgi:hypothetical protein
MRRLREEGARVQDALRESLHVLRTKLESQAEIEQKVVPQSKPTSVKANAPSPMADLLSFYSEERRNKKIS